MEPCDQTLRLHPASCIASLIGWGQSSTLWLPDVLHQLYMIRQCAQFTAAASNPTFPPPLVCAHHHCECSDYTPEGGFRCELCGSFQPEASVREENI